jgi:hypothetical protein
VFSETEVAWSGKSRESTHWLGEEIFATKAATAEDYYQT